MKCPKCGEDCDRDEVDVGVGVIYGPYGCWCGWSEDPRYDCSDGPCPKQSEYPGHIVDQFGGATPITTERQPDPKLDEHWQQFRNAGKGAT